MNGLIELMREPGEVQRNRTYLLQSDDIGFSVRNDSRQGPGPFRETAVYHHSERTESQFLEIFGIIERDKYIASDVEILGHHRDQAVSIEIGFPAPKYMSALHIVSSDRQSGEAGPASE